MSNAGSMLGPRRSAPLLVLWSLGLVFFGAAACLAGRRAAVVALFLPETWQRAARWQRTMTTMKA